MIRRSIAALILLAAAGCSAGGGIHTTPPVTEQNAAVTAPMTATRAVEGASNAKPQALVSGLFEPDSLALLGKEVYIGDTSIWRVKKNGSGAAAIVSGTAIFDSGFNRGASRLAFAGQQLFTGYGGYVQYNIISAPIGGGPQTVLTTNSGGVFAGISGTTAYYGSGFCCIRSIPTTGGSPTTIFSGVWIRSNAMDDTAMYFVEYFTKNVYRFDLTTHVLTPLIVSNPAEGSLVINSSTVFFSVGSTIQAIPKAGGTSTTIYTGTQPAVVAANDKKVFFTDNGALLEIPIAGGSAKTLVSRVTLTAAVAGKTHLYYSDEPSGPGSSIVYKIKF